LHRSHVKRDGEGNGSRLGTAYIPHPDYSQTI
jgi:hypothetical protein